MKAKRLFTAEANSVIASAFSWLGAMRDRPALPAIQPAMRQPFKPAAAFSRYSQYLCQMLRCMAVNSGWEEVGGRAIREQSDYQTGGDVIGRTVWLGKPDWAKGFGKVEEIQATVEKAIAGETLWPKQKLLIEAMLQEIEDMRDASESPEDCPF